MAKLDHIDAGEAPQALAVLFWPSQALSPLASTTGCSILM